MPQPRVRTASAAIALVLAGTAALGGCGSGSDAGPAPAIVTGSGSGSSASPAPSASATSPSPLTPTAPATASYTAADVEFAAAMLVYQSQGMALVEMLRGRAVEPRVSLLAATIAAGQAPVVPRTARWLRTWGESAATVRALRAGVVPGPRVRPVLGEPFGPGVSSTPGLLTAAELRALARIRDVDAFTTAWATAMVRHHGGAVEVARVELRDGRWPQARTLAQQIVDVQSAEILSLRGLI
ncbi:DUF305 domain-containing protein [Nocardioides sp. TRM66260-LWL]|uniref:DUF305 domain-containing protein n=1 Tax=Nocardioides sp. TRM66260-LWL TaxID=2874478 RepID=UPI001CC5299A|nr:DUF305 domain-containing protein [Nocardioides sp. TRM66260-LWL]MBZ5735812.1 DUF305 domain-containing protein [Nocardioides sp. TRM66260-LWL]